MADEIWHTISDVMRETSLTRHQVYRRIQDGRLRVRECGEGKRHYLVSDKDLMDLILTTQNPYRGARLDSMPVREAAAITGLSGYTVRRMCDEGIFDHTRGLGLRGQYRISRDSVRKYMENRHR